MRKVIIHHTFYWTLHQAGRSPVTNLLFSPRILPPPPPLSLQHLPLNGLGQPLNGTQSFAIEGSFNVRCVSQRRRNARL